MRVLGTLVSLVACSVAVAGPPAEIVRKEMARFEGTWRVGSITAEGTAAPAHVRTHTFTIKDRKVVLNEGGAPSVGVFEVEPRLSPAWINIGYVQGGRQGEIYPAIYKFNGEDDRHLLLCLGTNGARPTNFSGGQGQMLYVLSRVKP